MEDGDQSQRRQDAEYWCNYHHPPRPAPTRPIILPPINTPTGPSSCSPRSGGPAGCSWSAPGCRQSAIGWVSLRPFSVSDSIMVMVWNCGIAPLLPQNIGFIQTCMTKVYNTRRRRLFLDESLLWVSTSATWWDMPVGWPVSRRRSWWCRWPPPRPARWRWRASPPGSSWCGTASTRPPAANTAYKHCHVISCFHHPSLVK